MTNHISDGLPRRPVLPIRCRKRKRGIDLKGPFKPADIDTEFKGGGGADGHQGVIVLHFLFRTFPIGGRQVSVMDQKTVRLMIGLTVLPEILTDRFAFFPRIGEDETFLSAGMFKDIGKSRICGLWSLISRSFFNGHGYLGEILLTLVIFTGLGVGIIEMLHRKMPDFFFSFEFRNDSFSTASGGKKFAGGFRIADRCGKSDPPRIAAGKTAETLDETKCLKSPVAPKQRMNFIDDDKAKIVKERRNFHMLIDHERFQ